MSVVRRVMGALALTVPLGACGGPSPHSISAASPPPTATARTLCHNAFGFGSLNSAPGTVSDVRAFIPGGPSDNRPAPHAFPRASSDEVVGWCWTGGPGSYDLYAVAAGYKPVRVEGLGGPLETKTPPPGPAPYHSLPAFRRMQPTRCRIRLMGVDFSGVRRHGRMFLAAASFGLVLTLTGCVFVCSDVGYASGASVSLDSLLEPGPKSDVTLCLNKACSSYRPSLLPVSFAHVNAPIDQERWVTVSIVMTGPDGETLAHTSMRTRLHRYLPNGADCSPSCYLTRLTLTAAGQLRQR